MTAAPEFWPGAFVMPGLKLFIPDAIKQQNKLLPQQFRKMLT
jgi:hypothetical protein